MITADADAAEDAADEDAAAEPLGSVGSLLNGAAADEDAATELYGVGSSLSPILHIIHKMCSIHT